MPNRNRCGLLVFAFGVVLSSSCQLLPPQSTAMPTHTELVPGTEITTKNPPQALAPSLPVSVLISMFEEPSDYSNIAAGAGHTCVVTNQGRVTCWGGNQYGQLGGGDGTFTALEYAPVSDGNAPDNMVMTNVRGLKGKAVGISAGYYHTCAVTDGGMVMCWGWNAHGQLGDGTTMDSSTPVDVHGLNGEVLTLATGAEHTCALLISGTVLCWGENGYGQLGDGTNRNSSIPVKVLGLPGDIVQVVAGTGFSCALTGSGKLFCWGDGQNGRFGDGTRDNYLVPVELDGMDEPIVMLTSGDYHLCTQTSSGALICWGALSSDQEFTSQTPYVVNGFTGGIAQMVAGGGHTCALTTAGGVKCWGDNYFGQLGNGTGFGSWEPVDAMGLTSGILRIASGSGHVCALKIDGGIQCWGDNSGGQCGDSTLTWVWNSYANRKYNFTLDYPLGWKALEVPFRDYSAQVNQVWFSSSSFPPAQTGARADISLIITEDDPTPNWAPEFFDNYKSEVIQLGNVPALRISGTNKESRTDEIAILVWTGDYFILAIPNHSLESMKYFDQVMYTLTITREQLTHNEVTPPTVPPTAAVVGAESMIEFTYDATLAEGIKVSTAPAYVGSSGYTFNDIPGHIRVDFLNPYTLREPFTSLQWVAPWLQHRDLNMDQFQPQIFIFPVDAYQSISQSASEQVKYLNKLIGEEILPMDVELPVLPLFNSAQDLRAQAKPLAFQNGRGIRFITHYSQEMATVITPTVFYTFQGLTEDGQHYIAAFFPLNTWLLPSQNVADFVAGSSQEYQAYLAEISKRLEALRPEDFQPSLDLLDKLIQSTSINISE